MEKRKVAIQFGYHFPHVNEDLKSTGANEVAAQVVRKVFFQALKALYPSFPVEEDGETLTLASTARLRHPALKQDIESSGWADTIGINYKGGPAGEMMDCDVIVDRMKDLTIESDHHILSYIQVTQVEFLPVSTKFHAEKSCSQRAYQYLVPIKWIDASEETIEWVRQKVVQESSEGGHQGKQGSTPASLIRFKDALRLAESRDISEDSSSSLISSPGRFGKLWQKERRAWHNFCDQSLGGMASPSNEPVWRSVDRSRLSGFIVNSNNNDEALVVVEFKGDGFVTGQIRRILGTAIAITNNWLPSEFFDIATRSDVCIEAPVAPPGRTYFSIARFHFVELIKGSILFENSHTESERWLQLLQRRLLKERFIHEEEEKDWIKTLEENICPRIHTQLQKISSDDEFRRKQRIQENQKTLSDEVLNNHVDYSREPKCYEKTLSQLRDVCENRKWPMTSAARSRLIRSPITKCDAEPIESTRTPGTIRSGTASNFQGYLSQCGSFTVTNPKLHHGRPALGNNLFPGLVDAIFELETELATDEILSAEGMKRTFNERRKGSTHCAVNRNAEFTPHVDSGKGQGQSLSMIVGLGDFSGGGLFVEGASYDVRYKPLQFDGWKQIHSTEPFSGERYSLVWFTPEKREEHTEKGELSVEDSEAKVLVDVHTSKLPFYSKLKFRQNSTDALVIKEILDIEQGCCYELSSTTWFNRTNESSMKRDSAFSLNGHEKVLDIGAHIGVFSRYALSVGCTEIIAYEPEAKNFDFLEDNLKLPSMEELDLNPTVTIHKCAVCHGKSGMKKLVHARNRNDGSLNTWRHSLEDYSQYVDKIDAKMPSEAQNAILDRSQVSTVPFFGLDGALEPSVTFVKMDCEGAEIDILLSTEASIESSWLDVRNLVFEWSFTKERRIEKFHEVVNNLSSAGFTVVYEGKGSWWDTGSNMMWPYHKDLLIFALKDQS
jgi:FkbM family methyltransferase